MTRHDPGSARLLSFLVVALVGTGLLSGGLADPAAAARKHTGTSLPKGFDLSYPQCGATFPTGQAFGALGVTGGRANNANPCLGPHPDLSSSELYWAQARSSGAGGVAKSSLYANTADPGNMYNGQVVTTWPTSGTTPYGDCTTTVVVVNGVPFNLGENSEACAWEYGYQRARYAFGLASSAVGSINDALAAQGSTRGIPPANSYPWWLDVETGNTWQSGSHGIAMNNADIRGMLAELRGQGVSMTGVYSTSYQWNAIAGGAGLGSAVPDWVAGSLSESQAASLCGRTGFTGGPVKLAQYPVGSLDGDAACQ
jgi:hypothetical protein